MAGNPGLPIGNVQFGEWFADIANRIPALRWRCESVPAISLSPVLPQQKKTVSGVKKIQTSSSA
jgi:hypothetical protein